MSDVVKPVLKLGWCSYEAAKYAVEHWHYSKRMPMPPYNSVGVWEDGQYVGAVIFARGAAPTLSKSFSLLQTQLCELVRVALRDHRSAVSRIVTIAIKLMRTRSPGVRAVVSFADPDHGHHGGIYQAMGWVYTGTSAPEYSFYHGGRWKHRREVVSNVTFGKQKPMLDYKGLPKRLCPGKYRYALGLDDEVREQIKHLAKPYPKRPKQSNDAPGDQPGEGGAAPTRTLHSTDSDQAPF